MSTQQRVRPSRLGRGLSSLMAQPVQIAPPHPQATVPVPAPLPPAAAHEPAPALPPSPSRVPPESSPRQNPLDGHGLMFLPIHSIHPNPFQPRQQFDQAALDRLAQSIQADGVMQPILVRPHPRNMAQEGPVTEAPSGHTHDGHTYELIAGERRWRAAKLAGLTQIPAIVRTLDTRQVAEFALIENLQREDLNPMERAQAFKQLIGRFQLTHDQVAQRVGVDRSSISNSLRLLDLHNDVQEMLRQNLLSAGQAKALAGLSDLEQQRLLATKAVRGDWSVRQLEAAVRSLATVTDPAAPARPAKARAAHFADLEEQIGQQLGTKVHLHPGRKKGSGSINIEFFSLEQFDDLMSRLGVKTE